MLFAYYFDMNILSSGITTCPFSLCAIFVVGVRVFIPNFVQIDAMDHKENLRKIENAGVSYPMGEWQQSLKNNKKSNNNFHKGAYNSFSIYTGRYCFIEEVYSCKLTFDWHLELKP